MGLCFSSPKATRHGTNHSNPNPPPDIPKPQSQGKGREKMTQPIEIEDVKREVKILQALGGHENVVGFHNVFEDKNYVYIVMELCEGGELLDRILSKKDSRYTEKDAAVVVRQMLKVAAECHLRGLVHRDMKPEVELSVQINRRKFVSKGYRLRFVRFHKAWYMFQVMRKKPDFETTPWPTISDGAKDFVKKLLVKEPRARLTAAQALSHSWVREGGEASEIPIDISVLENMRQFVKFSRLKQIALKALATTIDEDELDDLRDQFDAIDIDKNGSISLEEMRQIDSNTDGLVDFTEFVVATLHVNQLEEHDSDKWEQRSRAAFEKFDVDRDGFITPEELRLQTGLKGSIEPLLEEADIDEDGRISIHEFRRLLRSASLKPRTVKSPPGYQLSRKM
ncbi:hypothetical protein HID58_013289 [Brassica napus]|uniref:non-specific serine/threonine protein kinase n=1 Tax=Brassica napus TaxID=3708 RepID=A0ABQ8E465_BRANA|nr:hypothetical protein HID58_013289 [Brassica napus]